MKESNQNKVVIERIHECMRLGLGDQEAYETELARLVDEFGVGFVSKYACEETWFGGEQCPLGRCERPDGHGVFDPDADGVSTRAGKALRDYVEFFVGLPCAN
jgi:hypothetical protein